MQRMIECPICKARSPEGEPSFKRCHHSDAEWAKYKAQEFEPETPFVHITPKPDACQHEFTGWREFEDGRGGEQVCKKCGMGAMAYSLATGI